MFINFYFVNINPHAAPIASSFDTQVHPTVVQVSVSGTIVSSCILYIKKKLANLPFNLYIYKNERLFVWMFIIQIYTPSSIGTEFGTQVHRDIGEITDLVRFDFEQTFSRYREKTDKLKLQNNFFQFCYKLIFFIIQKVIFLYIQPCL